MYYFDVCIYILFYLFICLLYVEILNLNKHEIFDRPLLLTPHF